MTAWSPQELTTIDAHDDLHIAPLRADGITHGTPTWIWSVVVDGELYVRAYNGTASRWYQAVQRHGAGRIRATGAEREVTFELIDAAQAQSRVQEAVDGVYRAKYAGSTYLAAMVSERARAATVRVHRR